MPDDENTSTGGTDQSPVERLLDERQLLVVSNRQPYSHEYDDGEIVVSSPAGGLTAALDPMIQSLGGTWIAWGSGEADEDVVDEHDRVAVPPDAPSYDLRRVWLDDDTLDGYYYGYSNRVLWPLCHGLPSKVTYDGEFWERYREGNDRFADAVAEEAGRAESLIWFHDYHFGLAPRTVRDRLGSDAVMGHFWHIPWPPWDVFRRCPRGEEVVAALLCNDLVGFQTAHDRRRFVRCAREALDAAHDPTTDAIIHDGRRTFVRAAPIRIDADAIERRARSGAVDDHWRSFASERDLGDVRVALGVERLDYTKGIEERLDALERLFEDHPEWRGELTYLQKATESRSRIDEYRALQRRVDDRVEGINRRFGSADWTPIVSVTEMLSQTALDALYRHADLALVTPIRDGLNLVAKEYVAAQVDGDGVLVLSDTAGVRETLGDDALLVNPLDTEAFATTLHRALEMPADERRERMASLRAAVRGDPSEWAAGFFGELVSVSNKRFPEDGAMDVYVE